MKEVKKAYVCSPYRGDTEYNVKVACAVARSVAKKGRYIPVVPHIYFTQFLDDEKADERELGIELGTALLKECEIMFVVGRKITEGMHQEISVARKNGIPIIYVDSPRIEL